MAHHNSTPRSILDAPKLTPVWLYQHQYPNRSARRRRPSLRRYPVNEPYRKEPTR